MEDGNRRALEQRFEAVDEMLRQQDFRQKQDRLLSCRYGIGDQLGVDFGFAASSNAKEQSRAGIGFDQLIDGLLSAGENGGFTQRGIGRRRGKFFFAFLFGQQTLRLHCIQNGARSTGLLADLFARRPVTVPQVFQHGLLLRAAHGVGSQG